MKNASVGFWLLSVAGLFVIPAQAQPNAAATVYVADDQRYALAIDEAHVWLDEIELSEMRSPAFLVRERSAGLPQDIQTCSFEDVRCAFWKAGQLTVAFQKGRVGDKYRARNIVFEIRRVESTPGFEGRPLYWIDFDKNGPHGWRGHFVYDEQRGVSQVTFWSGNQIVRTLVLVRGDGLLSARSQ